MQSSSIILCDDQLQGQEIVLAVTGHRDILPADIDILKETINSFFRKIQARYPDHQLVLLSALAEGADRLAARVALECRIDYTAVLPMPVDEYLADFVDSDSQKEFYQLLGKASDQIIVKPEKTADLTGLAWRERCYVAVGRYFSRYAGILIALWDGYNNRELGGTADVVRMFLAENSENIRGDSASGLEVQPVVMHIWSHRESAHGSDSGAHPTGSLRELFSLADFVNS